MTQELIANRLGVRHEGVAQAAWKLRDAGIINYSCGHIKVQDRLLSDIPRGSAFCSMFAAEQTVPSKSRQSC
jgi:hypothetical protein